MEWFSPRNAFANAIPAIQDAFAIFSLASGRKLTARLTAAQLQDCLAGRRGMIPCGASYVVNLAHVRCFSGTDLIMDGGERIPVPRRLRAQIKQAYFDFYLEEVRNG